jgi:large exoprotein involved in heme utilization and adhesion
LADGATFSAHLGEKSTLTVAPPAAFGFLGPTPAPITIQGSTLEVRAGKALSVIGGDVQTVGGTLRAPSGRIQLASVASPGDVRFGPLELAPDLQVEGFTQLGRLALSQGVNVTVSSDAGAGTILIRGGRLLVDRSSMFANTLGDVDSAILGLDIRVTEDVVLTNGARVRADTFGAGHGGDIDLRVGRFTLTGYARILSRSLGAGSAGTVTITATDSVTIAGRDSAGEPSRIFSNARSSGDGGRITISTPTLTMDDGVITTFTEGEGRAGDIELGVGRLTLTGGAVIDSSTRSTGRGGNIVIAATETITIAGHDRDDFPSGILSGTEGRGAGGDIHVAAQHIQLSDGGTISASSFGDGAAGNILLQASETFGSQHGAVTTTAAQAGGGRIELRAGRMVQLRDSQVTTSVQGGEGDAGNVTLDSTFVVAEGSQIIAQAFAGGGGTSSSPQTSFWPIPPVR